MESIQDTTEKLMRKLAMRTEDQPAPPKPYVPEYITPTLFPSDQAVLSTYMDTAKLPAFVMAVEQQPYFKCRNCGDMGKVWVRMAEGGPYPAPFGLATWFAGDGRFGKGWYTFKKSMFFDCPICRGL